MTWTPERIAEYRHAIERVRATLPQTLTTGTEIYLLNVCDIALTCLDALEAQQAELEAARRCADAAIVIVADVPETVAGERTPAYREWINAKADYQAARAGQGNDHE